MINTEKTVKGIGIFATTFGTIFLILGVVSGDYDVMQTGLLALILGELN